MTDVFFNGTIIGTTKDPEKLVNDLRTLRRKNEISSLMNVSFNKKSDYVYILTEAGRARRPLIIVENGVSKLTPELLKGIKEGSVSWSDLIKNNVIEFLDAQEEEDALIAFDEKDLTPEHTHLEIVKIEIFGSQSSLAPFAEHNKAGRIMLAAKMLTQGVGVYATNYNLRLDSDVSILHYPQKPIVNTLMYKNVKYDDHPVGQNVVIAVMTDEGYNLDDAIIFNKDSIQMGLFRSTFFKPYFSEEIKYTGGMRDKITNPITELEENDVQIKIKGMESDYAYLEEDGIIYPEAKVKPNTIIIGKLSPSKFLNDNQTLRLGVELNNDSSVVCKKDVGKVDSVIVTESEEGNKYVEVRIRQPRIPEIGDKFATRHGQKGVIGMLVPKEDMPFTNQGVVPDVIFSPHSIPSRMTIGQLIEIIGGKVGALSGRYVDGTAFTGEKEMDLREELHKLGFKENGAETLYDGKTGRMLKSQIFIGTIYYLRLKYMVTNKYHMRTRGPVQLLTRQPTEGRAKEGGLRLGEMEKDVIVAHGAALLLKERFSSDNTIFPVCLKCGNIAYVNQFRNKTICPVCGENASISFIEMSYAFKLLLDELKSLCIYPKLNLKYKE